jgi:outer membrane protein assembly factor BamB
MRHAASAFVFAALVVAGSQLARADDWPQWLGESRDGVWHETGILKAFPPGGTKVLWRAGVAGGYSGPAVAEGRVFVTDYVLSRGEITNDPVARTALRGKERVLCFDAASGKPLWTHEYDCPYNVSYPAGPRTTPAISEGKVYTLGAEGHLLCLAAADGKVLWSKDLKQEYKVETPLWGFCGHPLVEGDTLFCLVGGPGSVAVAFEKDSGRELWRALSAPEPGYCPPTMIEAGGARQLLIWHPWSMNSLNPETGEVYWSLPLEPNYQMSIAAPQKAGDYLFASAIGNCGALFELDRNKPAAEVVWRARPGEGVFAANSTPMLDGGHIYGADCQIGALVAAELETGKRLWETFQPTTGGDRRASHGTAFLTKNGDRYFLFSETGDLIIARLSPEGYDEISRVHLLEPTNEVFGRSAVWSHPAYANRCIFARNDKELICVSLAAE